MSDSAAATVSPRRRAVDQVRDALGHALVVPGRLILAGRPRPGRPRDLGADRTVGRPVELRPAQPERPHHVVDAGDDRDDQRRAHEPRTDLRQRRVERPAGTRRSPAICSAVLILPPRLAGMTPCRITQNRSAVTPHSRARITTVTHHGSAPYADSSTSALPVSALSAIGSATLPNEVTRSQVRAIQPSTKSVADGDAERDAGGDPQARVGHLGRDGQQRRRPGRARCAARSARWPGSPAAPGRPAGSWARLALLGDHGAVRHAGDPWSTRHLRSSAAPPAPPRSSRPARRSGRRPRCRRPAPGRGRPGRSAARSTPPPPRPACVRAVDLGRLVRGPALDRRRVRPSRPARRRSSRCRSSARWAHSSSASALSPSYRRLIVVVADLAGQPGGLGAVLVAVVEDADRVEAGLGQEALQLGVRRPRSRPGSRR